MSLSFGSFEFETLSIVSYFGFRASDLLNEISRKHFFVLCFLPLLSGRECPS